MFEQRRGPAIKSRRVTLSRKAAADLISIFQYIAEDDPVAAERLIHGINRKVEHAARSGFTGANRDWVAPGLRAIIYQSRCIYFIIRDKEFHVVRIVHGHQDTSPEDFSESSI